MGRERVYCVYRYTASAYQDTYMEQVLNENIHLIYSHSPCCPLIEKPRDSDLWLYGSMLALHAESPGFLPQY